MNIIKLKNAPEGNTIKHSFDIDCEYLFKKNNISANTKNIIIKIVNAGSSPYSDGWKDYQPFITKDMKNYTRIKSCDFDGRAFSFKISRNIKRVCWFPYYGLRDLNFFLESVKNNLYYNGDTPYIKYGESAKPCIVFLARQHPAESMGSFFLEGFIRQIFSHKYIDKYSFVFFPMINIEGIKKLTHRLTPDGVDLNRSWDKENIPSIDNVKKVLNAVQNIECVIDLHGDEISKHNFYIGTGDKSLMRKLFPQFIFLPKQSWLKRFVKALIRKRQVLSLFTGKTANEYFIKKSIPIFTVEFSAHKMTPLKLKNLGEQAAKNIT